jgi:hypothetical protein
VSDLEILQRFRDDVPPADPVALRRGRDRLAAEIAPRTAIQPRWYARPRWYVAAAAIIVAVAFAGLSTPRPALIGPDAGGDTEAARVLQQAALTAMLLTPASVRPDQFVFVEQVRQDSSDVPSRTGPDVWSKLPEQLYQWWLSADGRSNGLIRSYYTATNTLGDNLVEAGCAKGHPNPVPSNGVTLMDPCTPTPAYRGDLPTSVDAMLAYLYRPNPHNSDPLDQQAFTTVGQLVVQSYIPPAALSALFSAAARIPGVTVEHDIVDAAGRHGIAVGRTFKGIQDQLIFDSKTYAFLGERSVAVENVGGLPTGWVLSYTAMLRVAIVDRPGQLP